MMKQAQKIEVGLHEGRPGFTVEYTDGERAHFVFNRGIAQSLSESLLKIVRDLDYMDRQMSGVPFQEKLSVSEKVQVKLTPPSGSLGIDAGEGVNVNE